MNILKKINIFIKVLIYLFMSIFEILIIIFFRLFKVSKNYKNIFIKTDNIGDNLLFITALRETDLSGVLIITTQDSRILYQEFLPDVDVISFDRASLRSSVLYRLQTVLKLSGLETKNLVMPISQVDWLSAGSIFILIKSNKRFRLSRGERLHIGEVLLRLFVTKASVIDVGIYNEAKCLTSFLSEIKILEKAVYTSATVPRRILVPERVLIFPYTTDEGRDISEQQLEYIIKFLNQRNIKPYVLGLRKKPYILSAKLEYYDLCNQTSVKEVIDMVRIARCVICAESGPYHIAQLMNVNTLLLAGGGHFGRFFSNNKLLNNYVVFSKKTSCFFCDWVCKFHYTSQYPCILNINIDEVTFALSEILGETYD